MTDQKELWSGVFGDAYQERNRLTAEETAKRQQFFEGIYRVIYQNCGDYPKSILEIGAGQGPNLSALERLSIKIQKPIKLYATEINQKARIELSQNVPNVEILTDTPPENLADLVFTYGVMIHTHPAHIAALQSKIYKASKRWIMCVEYFSPVTRAIPYRGEKDALWLDDYGGKWLDNHSLKVIGYGFCWKRITGLDDVTFTLFEKMDWKK